MDTGLKDKVVLVTGGAGGIGSAIVRAFAGEEARPIIHFLTNEERATTLGEETGGVPMRADLTKEAEVDELFARAIRDVGKVDVLVANAGRWPSDDKPVWEMSLERWRGTIAVNLEAVFMCCRAFLRHVKETGVGNIVLISSTAGIFGEAGHSDYAAAKSALAGGFLNSLKNEIVRIAPLGRVNAVCPGWTATDMTREALQDQKLIAKITRTMALDKIGVADDVARAVVTLSSDRLSGHVTGEVITIAGGMEGRILR